MEIERLSARVDADTTAAELALGRLDKKLDKVADDRTAHIRIFYDEKGGHGGSGGGLPGFPAPSAGSRASGPGVPGIPDLIPGDGGGKDKSILAGGLGGLVEMVQDLVGKLDELVKPLAAVGEQATEAASGATKLTKPLGAVGDVAGSAASGMAMMGKKAIVLAVLFFAILPAIMSLIPAIIALGGYVVGLVLAFAPLVGVLFALPGLFLGLLGVMGVVMIVMKTLTEAFMERNEAIKNADQLLKDHTRAQEAVTAAERQHTLATRANTNARRDAAEAMEDAQFAAEGAQLGEERAVLALEKAYARLADVQGKLGEKTEEMTLVTDDFTGKQFEVARITYDAASSAEDMRDAQLGVKDAELQLRMAKDRRLDTEIALEEITKRGIENSDIVLGATIALTSATNALNDARQKEIDTGLAQEGGKAFVNLSPESQGFIDKIVEFVNGPLKELMTSITDTITPFLSEAFDNIKPVLDMLLPILQPIADGLGKMMAGMTEAFSTEQNIDNLVKFGEGLGTFLAEMGPVLGTFLGDMLTLIIEAEPLLTAAMDIMKEMGAEFTKWAEGDSSMGDLGVWFELTGTVLKDSWDIIKNLMGFFTGVMTAAMPFTTWVRDNLVGATEDMNKWANSEDGQESIAGFFERIKVPLEALAGLFGDIFGGLMAVFGSQEAMDFLVDFIKVTRKDVLPAIFGLLDALITSGFMSGLTQFVGSVVGLLSAIAKAQGAEAVLAIMGALLQMFSLMLDALAGFWTLMGSVTGFGTDAIVSFINTIDWNLVEAMLIESIKIVADMVGGALGGIWDSVWDGMVNAFWSAYDMIINPLNSLIRKFDKLPGPDIGEISTSAEIRGPQEAAKIMNENGISIADISSAVRDKIAGYYGSGGEQSSTPSQYITQNNTFTNQTDPAATNQAITWSLASMLKPKTPHMIAAPTSPRRRTGTRSVMPV